MYSELMYNVMILYTVTDSKASEETFSFVDEC